MKKVILIFILTIVLISSVHISYSVSSIDVMSLEEGYQMFEKLLGKTTVLDARSNVSEETKMQNNMLVLGVVVFLMSYWIWLLYKYEKEEDGIVKYYVNASQYYIKN